MLCGINMATAGINMATADMSLKKGNWGNVMGIH